MRFSYLIVLSLMTSSWAFAADSSEYGAKLDKISAATLHDHFHLHGRMFMLSKDGRQLHAPTSEERDWRPGVKSDRIESFWKVSFTGFKPIALHTVWVLKPDNSIDVLVEQCEDIQKDHCTKVSREQKFTLENFAPVTWVAETNDSQRVVAQLSPVLDDVRERAALDRITVGGDRGSFEVFDNQGYHWSDQTRFGGVISGLKGTRGSIVFSLYPFTGAKEIGTARGNTIEIFATDKLKITVRGDRDIIPGEAQVKVYGKYLPKLKSKGVNYEYSFGHEKESTLPAEFR